MHRSALGAGALSDEWAKDRLPAHTARDDFIFLVAREGDEVAGFGYGYTGATASGGRRASRSLTAAQRAEWLDPPHYEIVELHVGPRGSGAASAAPCSRSS